MEDQPGWRCDGADWIHPELPYRIEKAQNAGVGQHYAVRSRSGVLLAVRPHLAEAQIYCQDKWRMLDGLT